MLELGAQIKGRNHSEIPSELLESIRPQILAIWDSLVGHGQSMEPAPDIGAGESLCFRQLLLPMRACSGSILPNAWDDYDVNNRCEGGNPIMAAFARTLRASARIARADAAKPAAARAGGSRSESAVRHADQITVFTRHGAHRALVDEKVLVAAIEKRCAHRQIETVELGNLTLLEQVAIMERSSVLIGPHGSGLTLMLYAPKGLTVIEITEHPPMWVRRTVHNIYARLTSWAGHDYHFVYGVSDYPPITGPEIVLHDREAGVQHSKHSIVLCKDLALRPGRSDRPPP